MSADLSDMYVARFDASGNHLWSKRYGDNNSQQGGFVAAYDAQNVLISGYFNGVVDLGGGPLSSLNSASISLAKLRLP